MLLQGYYIFEVIVKSLGVENPMVSQDLMVGPDAILAPKTVAQFVFSGEAGGFLVPTVLLQAPCCLAFPLEGKGPQRFYRCRDPLCFAGLCLKSSRPACQHLKNKQKNKEK